MDKKQLALIQGREFRDISLFDEENPTGRIMGRNVRINVNERREIIVVSPEGMEILRAYAPEVKLLIHQGWGGITLICPGEGQDRTWVLHSVLHVRR